MINPSAFVPEKPRITGIKYLHHVAIAVAEIEPALALWQNALGAQLELRAVVEEQGVDAASLELTDTQTLIELIAPLTPESGLNKFIHRGGGLHHIAWAVESVEAALKNLNAHDFRLIDETPRIGLHQSPVAFVHPKSFTGVLVELVEVD